MKNYILLFVLLSIGITSCKKKEDKKDESTTTTTGTTGAVTVPKQVSVKINGTEFSCSSCGNTYYSGGMRGVNFSEGGANRFVFLISGPVKAGTYPIAPAENTSLTYEKDGRYYYGRGQITLTAVDTSAKGNITKFIGTFNCVTDTNNGKAYTFSDGTININY